MDLLITLLALILVSLTQISGNAICGPNDNYLPNPLDCGSFYQCSNGNAILMPCPSALVFDPSLSVCVRRDEYDCQPTTEEPSTTTIITETTTITMESLKEKYCPRYVTPPEPDAGMCAGVANDSYLPDPYECHNYYHCLNGVPIQYKYRTSFMIAQVWDDKNKKCEYPMYYDCRHICQTKTDADVCLNSKSVHHCTFCFDSNFNNDSRCDEIDYLVNAGCEYALKCWYQ